LTSATVGITVSIMSNRSFVNLSFLPDALDVIESRIDLMYPF